MKTNLIFIAVLLCTSILSAQSIVVNDPGDPQSAFTAEELVQEVLVSGSSCVQIELTSIAENPGGVGNINEQSWGYFKKGNTNFPFDEGIILSTGFAVNAEGPNDETGSSDIGTNWVGDADIKAILDNQYGTNVDTNNATAFTFTFTSSIDEVDFEFIFASEEYENEWECSDQFRDGFAFLVSGPGIPNTSGAPFGGVNVASITGSNNVPVSTATIHRDTFTCGFEVLGVNYFPNLYVSNTSPNLNEIQFDGLTATLTTATVTVIPNEEYTVKMVIADRGDSSFDSAVFLKAGSFNIGNVDLGGDILLGDPNAKCEGEIIVLDAGSNPTATFAWFKDGILLPGETSQTLEISETGVYRVELTFPQSPNCITFDEILVEFFDVPDFDLGPDQLICDEQTVIIDATVSNPGELTNISYKWFKDGTEIPGETNPTLEVSETGTYSAEVTGNECPITDSVFIELVSFTVDIGGSIELCGEDNYEIVPIITGADPANATYLWSTGETTPTIIVTEDGTYTVEVTIDGCTEIGELILNFRTLPEIELGGDTLFKCREDIEILSAIPTNVNPANVVYRWYMDGGELIGETSSTLEVTEEGIYAVEVDDDGCIASDSISVEFYENENCVITQGISPNGDGFNDTLDLTFLNDKFGIIRIDIYNRHGRLVYEKESYVNEWGGQTNDGNILPIGTYFYVITLESDESRKGWIYLNK